MNKYFIAFFLLFNVAACTSNKKLLPSKKEILKAEVLIRQGRLDAANQKLDGLLKIYPTSGEIAYRAGMVKYHLNDKQKALYYLKKADSLSQGTNQDVIFASGVCSYETGRYTMAEAYFNRLKEVNNDSSRKEKVEWYLAKIIKVKDLMKDSLDIKIKVCLLLLIR